jgi:hypothetical protein
VSEADPLTTKTAVVGARTAPAPRSFRIGPLRATAFAELETGLEQRARDWLERGPGPQDELLKRGRVWRHGKYAVKLFPARASVALGLRRSAARLNADLHERLFPVRTPEPYLVLESRAGSSLLVFEFIEGRFLTTLWDEGGPAVAAFPHFMALMHQNRVFHGDFHLYNVIWNGSDWLLLDLEGLRHALRRTRPRRLSMNQWGRVHLGLHGPRGLKQAFSTYVKAAGLAWDVEREWPKIVALSAQMAVERGLDPAYTLRDGLDPVPERLRAPRPI